MLRILERLAAFCLVVAGVALLSIPAALIIAGLLLVVDVVT